MSESKDFLKEQIITYIGNKRKLLPYIEAAIRDIQRSTEQDKFVCADLFSGSGIVARMLKQYSSELIVNDYEDYSRIINQCYLTNEKDIDWNVYNNYKAKLSKHCSELHGGIITDNYAPKDESNITINDRVFYTRRNAMYIDTAMQYILTIPEEYRHLFIAPLLYEASVHANTSGVFKGFYKDKNTKIGQFGGTDENCLDRIKGEISIKTPVLSNYSCKSIICQGDTNQLAKELTKIDITYLDPPYNQHGYGSNYFMLNTICNYKLGNNLSKVSGIPSDWQRSVYNQKKNALVEFEHLIKELDSKYIIISYNSEGFITKDEMTNMLKKFGSIKTIEIKYNTFRGSRNLAGRSLYVNEYIFVLHKGA